MPESVSRPMLRYHGGKWRLAPWIMSHFPEHRTYTECFGGAASLLLRKDRSYAEVYNDLDDEIVNVFRVVRDNGSALVKALEATPFARAEYIASREPSDEPLERARRTIVRSFMGFGSNAIRVSIKSGFRASSNRSGTTPAHDWANFPAALTSIVKRMQGVVIENLPAFEVLRRHDTPETLHYVDPPYVHSTRMNGCAGKGYDHEMTDDQHAELLEALCGLEGMVVLSGYPCELYDEALTGWTCERKAALADGARQRTEALWLSPRVSERLGRLFGREAVRSA